MAGKRYSEEKKIVYYDTDISGRLSLGKLVDFMMLVSSDQSKQLDVSLQQMKDEGLGWVVTQHIIKIKKMPRLDDTIKITTQAKTYNRFFCYRDFEAEDQAGNLIATMHSVFVMMNLKKRRMVRLEDRFIEAYEGEYTTKIERLASPQPVEKPDQEHDYRVRFMDIDINRHVNNAHYIDWMLDTLEPDFLLHHELTEMNILYKKEVSYGSTVTSRMQRDGLKTYHEILNDGEPSCLAECQWKEV